MSVHVYRVKLFGSPAYGRRLLLGLKIGIRSHRSWRNLTSISHAHVWIRTGLILCELLEAWWPVMAGRNGRERCGHEFKGF